MAGLKPQEIIIIIVILIIPALIAGAIVLAVLAAKKRRQTNMPAPPIAMTTTGQHRSYCPQCGQPLAPTARFCANCGAARSPEPG